MEQKIKKSYENLRMSEDSKRRIYQEILDHDMPESRKRYAPGWKAATAACVSLALLIPGGAYAAGKIAEYYKVNIKTESYKAEIRMQDAQADTEAKGVEGSSVSGETPDKKMTYIKVTADFGSDYTTESTDARIYYVLTGTDDEHLKKVPEKIEEGSDGMYTYSHKDGFYAAKDFLYDVIYADTDGKSVLNLYDQKKMKEMTVNGHKAFLCISNGVTGSQYQSDEDTNYAIHLYLFYDEYGYIIELRSMKGLGEKQTIHLAEKIKVKESTKEKSSRYEYLSSYYLADTDPYVPNASAKEITKPVHRMGEAVKSNGITYRISEVQVSDKMPQINERNFLWDNIELNPSEYLNDNKKGFKKASAIWEKDGTLKNYLRETLGHGDGIADPYDYVTGTEKVKLKAVNVTMKVTVNKKSAWCFELPCMDFFGEKYGKYYATDTFEMNYNRPDIIHDLCMDHMPCYFKETTGGKSFYLKYIDKGELKVGEETTYHFTYIVDEDMVDHMVLNVNHASGEDEAEYIVLEPGK